MKTKTLVVPVVAFGLGVLATLGYQGIPFGHADQPYKGQEGRQISSLSESDIEALKKGSGWGLAKPAELNGYPGPAHILELDKDLHLDEAQRGKIQEAFNAMQAKAKVLGERLIEAEAAIDELFDSNLADEDALKERLNIAADVRGELRAVHLAAHIEVTPLLTDVQKEKYQELRGYNGGHSGHKGH